MNHSVIIKSFPNGISVYLDAEAPYEEIAEEVREKFTESARFFKDAKMAVSFEGRELSEAEERKLIAIITECSNLQVMCIVGKDDVKNQVYVKALKQSERHEEEHYAQFFRGNLNDHEVLETDRSIIIIGDVSSGCVVSSPKDIIILGGLYGEAYAGAGGEEGHYIVALEMSPEKLKIGDVRYKAEKAKRSSRNKLHPRIAYVKGNRIVMESITKDLLREIQ